MFGFGSSKKKYEEEMAAWLEQSPAPGARPTTVKHKRTYQAKLAVDGPMEIHLIAYTLPDGKTGRGFVNPPLTHAFTEDTNGMNNEDLVLAYCGWAWMTGRLKEGKLQTTFDSDGEEEASYLAQKKEEGFTDLEVTARYKIGENEFFELKGAFQGQPARAAGNTLSDTAIAAADPCYQLPAVYFLLGAQAVQSMH